MKTLLIAWKLAIALVLSNCLVLAQAYPPKFVWGDGTDALEPFPGATEYQQNAIPQHVLNARWDQSSVWHKNMELICPTNIPNGPENLQFTKITHNAGEMYCFIGTENVNVNVMNVTNPRSATLALNFKVAEDASSTAYQKVGNTETWIDTRLGSPLYNHTIMMVAVENLDIDKDLNTVVNAMFLIIDVTAAINVANANPGVSPNFIIDYNERGKTQMVGVPSSTTHTVCIGYIKDEPDYLGRKDDGSNAARHHTISMEKQQGILVLSPLHATKMALGKNQNNQERSAIRGFVGVYKIGTVAYHPSLSSTSTFVTPTALVEKYIYKTGSTQTLAEINVPVRIRTNVNDNATILFTNPALYEPAIIHESHAHRVRELDANGVPTDIFVQNKITLYAGAYTNYSNPGEVKFGGVCAQDIQFMPSTSWQDEEVVTTWDFTNNSGNQSNIVFLQHWDYDNDRAAAIRRKTDKESTWYPKTTHTVEGLHYNHHNHLFLTVEEMSKPRYFRPGINSSWNLNLEYNNAKSRGDVNIWGTTYYNNSSSNGAYFGLNGNFYSDIYSTFDGIDYIPLFSSITDVLKDERRIGYMLRVWQSSKDHKLLRGYGADETAQTSSAAGPVGVYDVPETTVEDFAQRGTMAVVHPEDVTITNSLAKDPYNSTLGDAARGVNGIHHVRTVYSANGKLLADSTQRGEVFVGYYNQGARVVSLDNFFHEEDGHPEGFHRHTIKELAYFDPIPTLNNDPASLYFWANTRPKYEANKSISEPWGFYQYTKLKPDVSTKADIDDIKTPIFGDIPMYFQGALDVYPDVYDENSSGTPLRTGFEKDENYVYSQMWTGTCAPWSGNRVYILRYFRDKIGGVISGYDGSAVNGDRPFKYVNLQGKFAVERDVTIASGATVTLLPGTPNAPGTHEETSLYLPTSTARTLYVEGTLIVGDSTVYSQNIAYQTSQIRIGVNIVVRNGGKLIFNRIEGTNGVPIVVEKNITAENGSTVQFNRGSWVILNGTVNLGNSNFLVLGEHSPFGILDRVRLLGKSTIGSDFTATNESNSGYTNVECYSTLNLSNPNGYFKIHNADILNLRFVGYGMKYLKSGADGWINGIQNSHFEVNEFFGADIRPGTIFSLPIVTAVGISQTMATSRINIASSTFSYVPNNATTLYHTGVTCRRMREVNIYEDAGTGNSFSNFQFCLMLDHVTRANVKSNSFFNSELGVHETASNGLYCNNVFSGTEYGIHAYSNFTDTYYDNSFSNVTVASELTNTGEQFYRHNQFSNYGAGIDTYNGNVRMHVVGTSTPNTWIKYGRNSFSVVPGYVPNFWANSIADIMVRRFGGLPTANISLECGKNSFAQNSTLHVSGTNLFNPEYNLWNPNPLGLIRCDIPPIPIATMQLSEGSDVFCGTQFTSDYCPYVQTNICPECPIITNDGTNPTLDNLRIIERYNASVVNIKDNTQNAELRSDNVFNAVSLLTLLDTSVVSFTPLINDLHVVLTEPGLHYKVKNTVLTGLSTIYDILDNSDSTIYYLEQIRANGGFDSTIATWGLHKKQASMNVGRTQDSLYSAHIQIVIEDLRNRGGSPAPLMQRKSSLPPVAVNSESNNADISRTFVLTTPRQTVQKEMRSTGTEYIQTTPILGNIAPNPSANDAKVSYSIFAQTKVRFVVCDITGKEVQILVDSEQKPGEYNVTINSATLTPGVYLYRLEAQGSTLTNKFTVIR